jgi:hypothetical protein
MSKQKKIEQFDPNGPATHVGIFGLPFTTDEAEVVIVPVPWEVTVSYGSARPLVRLPLKKPHIRWICMIRQFRMHGKWGWPWQK